MTAAARVGLLGGTFDPIHSGHLAAARAAQGALALDKVRFIPSARPPHRPDSPRASEYHRLEMIRLALAEASNRGEVSTWEVSDLEIRRHGPSYTYDTLDALHAEGLRPLQIFFITGADAFAEISTWYRYPAVLDSAHFVVVTRPGMTHENVRRRLPELADRMIAPAQVANSAEPRIILIESNTPEVSSTDIRRRAASGASIEGLVTPAVAAYISQHQLYRDVPAAPTASGAPIPPVAPAGR